MSLEKDLVEGNKLIGRLFGKGIIRRGEYHLLLDIHKQLAQSAVLLKPFADEAAQWEANEPDSHHPVMGETEEGATSHEQEAIFCLGDLRAAADFVGLPRCSPGLPDDGLPTVRAGMLEGEDAQPAGVR